VEELLAAAFAVEVINASKAEVSTEATQSTTTSKWRKNRL
jgi:hypothetical protein